MLLRSARLLIVRMVRSETFSSTVIMSIGLGARLILTTAAFVIVSRFMGAAEFGAFGSVVALVNIIGAFSGWGAEVFIIKIIAQNPGNFARAWGTGLAFLGVSAPPLAFLALFIVPLFVDAAVSPELIMYVVIADIIFARLNVIGTTCYRAVDRPMGAAQLLAGFSAVRLAAALLWIWIAGTDARSWGAYYCGASALGAIASLLLVRRDLGAPVWTVMWKEWRDGFHFSLLSASNSAAINIATPVVALLSDLSTAGTFAAAMRIVEAASVPFSALMFSLISRFFRLAVTGGAHESRKLAVRMLPLALITAFIGTVGILVVAPIAPWLLGQSYTGSSKIMMVLSVLPILYASYILAADVLISIQYVKARLLMQCFVPLVNIACCEFLVPRFGGVGAAVSMLISNTVLAGAAWIIVLIVSHEGHQRLVPKGDG